jgi:hypothetical protein
MPSQVGLVDDRVLVTSVAAHGPSTLGRYLSVGHSATAGSRDDFDSTLTLN